MNDENYKKLNELIRTAADRNDTSQKRPSDDALYACLNGVATPEQLQGVQGALNNSASFRNEFKKIIADHLAMEDLVNDPVFQNADVILPHSLQRRIREEYPDMESSFLKHENEAYPEPVFVGAKAMGGDFENVGESFLKRVLELLISSRITQVSIIGALAIVTIMIVRSPAPIQLAWNTEIYLAEGAELISISTRGATAQHSYKSDREAALSQFRQLGAYDLETKKYTTYRYDIKTKKYTPYGKESHSLLDNWFGSWAKVSIVDLAEKSVGSIWFNEDELISSDVSDIRLWSLDPSTMEMKQSALPDFDHPIMLSLPDSTKLALAITYHKAGKFHVAGGVVVSIPH